MPTVADEDAIHLPATITRVEDIQPSFDEQVRSGCNTVRLHLMLQPYQVIRDARLSLCDITGYAHNLSIVESDLRGSLIDLDGPVTVKRSQAFQAKIVNGVFEDCVTDSLVGFPHAK